MVYFQSFQMYPGIKFNFIVYTNYVIYSQLGLKLSKIALDLIISTFLGYPEVWTGEGEGGNVGLRWSGVLAIESELHSKLSCTNNFHTIQRINTPSVFVFSNDFNKPGWVWENLRPWCLFYKHKHKGNIVLMLSVTFQASAKVCYVKFLITQLR